MIVKSTCYALSMAVIVLQSRFRGSTNLESTLGNTETPLSFCETCHIGPPTRPELRDHLMDQHLHDYFHKTYLLEYFATLGFLGKCYRRKRQHPGFSLFDIAQMRKEEKATCPLQELGCDFQLSLDYPYMRDHLLEHSIEEYFKAHSEFAVIYPIEDI
jgi:hypothetical protein